MEYRSSGKIYIPDDVYANMDKELIISLAEDWCNEEDNYWSFDDWRWYEGFEDVDMWNRFYFENQKKGVDFVVIGEDNAIVVEPQFNKLGYSMSIETI